MFKHFPIFEGHTSSVMHTNETLNLLTKLWSFKVIWIFFFFGVVHVLCTLVDGLTKNVVKQNVYPLKLKQAFKQDQCELFKPIFLQEADL
jgi:hypothetical protein